MTDATLRERPDAGNPHVRIGEGNVAPAAAPRRGSLFSKAGCVLVAACAAVLEALAAGGRLPPLVGDGVADDTAAIQAAIVPAAPKSASSGCAATQSPRSQSSGRAGNKSLITG